MAKHLPIISPSYANVASGSSLIELLLVLTLIVIISMVGINRYNIYQQQKNITFINDDLTILVQHINEYFNKLGCSEKGEFQGDASPTLDMLELARLASGRPPLVTGYHVKVITLNSQDWQHKPRYQFSIQADMQKHLTTQQLAWLQSRLNANSIDSHQLVWIVYPNRSNAMELHKTWLLKTYMKQNAYLFNLNNKLGKEKYRCAQ